MKEHANLSEWPFELVPDEPSSPAAALAGMPHHMTEAPVGELDEDDDRIPEGDPLIPLRPRARPHA